ncbi:hypothetical protein [Actinoallomurus iriomotensis]|uniref:Uncharacterized protein n=1 Tax=Actinoallomurus iriomotensis TaxID=478107 RepID=A0A9W6RTB9_9ACTN|nr:hypothetical protein [Actinoallomurus iriomotensis]GLY81194.1 hypothetical protein Airi01_094610 [Actinoallomurus iriomotensis]
MLRIAGILLAGTGAAHFAAPQVFDPISKAAFPDDTRQWTYRNGAIEVALGLALTTKRTRLLGLAGTAGYAGWLASRVRANRGASQ